MTDLDEMKQRMAAVSTSYADAEQCECGALIEERDDGAYRYWLHVKRMRISYDHAAVPMRSHDH